MKRYYSFPILIALACVLSMCAEIDTKHEYYNPNEGIPELPGMIGKGGSMARFAISGNTLYALTNAELKMFDIKTPAETTLKNSVWLDWGMETIFPYDSLLFLGSMQGMYLYTQEPNFTVNYLTHYRHVTACDPVVFDGTYAYVTLNTNSWICGRGENELHILNMSTLTTPFLEKTYTMSSPKGLGVDGDLLFVCDKDQLKVFSKTNVLNLQKVAEFSMQDAYDVIPNNGNLIVTGSGGVYQYTYDAQEKTITLLSTILTEK